MNMGSQRKPKSLFPDEPTAGVFTSPAPSLVLLETILNKAITQKWMTVGNSAPARIEPRSPAQ